MKLNNSGFSLLETLVATTMFIFVTGIILSIFQDSIMTQRNAVATQGVHESMRYTFEMISKELRSAKVNVDIDGNKNCFPGGDILRTIDNKVYNEDTTENEYYFRNRLDECVYYYLSAEGQFIRRIGALPGLALPLTPKDVEVTGLKMTITDDAVGAFHSVQPTVTLRMEFNSKKEKFNNIVMQTTVSSRHYE